MAGDAAALDAVDDLDYLKEITIEVAPGFTTTPQGRDGDGGGYQPIPMPSVLARLLRGLCRMA
jgi:hypothetical protein